jgi:hypothetical protein
MKRLNLSLVLLLSIKFISADYKADILAYNPLHYWIFNNNFTDYGIGSTANGNNGGSGNSYQSSISQGSTQAIQFNGNGYISIPNRNDINTSSGITERTWMGWIVVNSDYSPSVIYEEGGTVNNLVVFAMAGGSLGAQIVMSNTSPQIDAQLWVNENIEYGKAYHFAYTFKRNDEFKIYLNGVLQKSVAVPNSSIQAHSGDINFGRASDLIVGGNSLALSNAKAKLAHVAMWNTALNESQIKDIFEKGAIEINSTLTLANLPSEISIGLFKLTNIGGSVTSELVAPQAELPGNTNIDLIYPITTYQPTRVIVRKYGKETFMADISLDRFNNSVYSFFNDDLNISEPNANTVNSYSSINNTNQLYDRIKLWEYKHPEFSEKLINPIGSALSLHDNWNLIFDKTASQAFNVNTGTKTITVKTDIIKSTDKFDKFSNNTTAISAINGAFIDFAYIDSNNDSYVRIINVDQTDTVSIFDGSTLKYKRTGEYGFAYNSTNQNYKVVLNKADGIEAMKFYDLNNSGIDNEFSVSFTTINNSFTNTDRTKLYETSENTRQKVEDDSRLLKAIKSWLIMLTKKIQETN